MDIYKIIRIVNIATVIQGFVLSAAIFHVRKKAGKSLVFLSLLMLTYSLGNLANLIVHPSFEHYYWHRFILVPFYSVIGPVFYFYIASFTGFSAKVPKIFHLVSFTMIFVGFVINMITKVHDYGPIDMADFLITGAMGVQVIIYIGLSAAAYLSYKRKILEYYSSTGRFRVLWLSFFLAASIISWMTLIIIEYNSLRAEAFGIFWLLISVIVYAVGYIGIKQPEILGHLETEPKKKYEKTSIDPGKLMEFDGKLSFAVDEKAYLDPDISLPALARQIGIQTYQLSQLINEKGMNFYEYINRLRIDHAKRLILDSRDSLNIARVAFDSGFNSISAFNSSFKKYSGTTPSAFAKKNKLV